MNHIAMRRKVTSCVYPVSAKIDGEICIAAAKIIETITLYSRDTVGFIFFSLCETIVYYQILAGTMVYA